MTICLFGWGCLRIFYDAIVSIINEIWIHFVQCSLCRCSRNRGCRHAMCVVPCWMGRGVCQRIVLMNEWIGGETRRRQIKSTLSLWRHRTLSSHSVSGYLSICRLCLTTICTWMRVYDEHIRDPCVIFQWEIIVAFAVGTHKNNFVVGITIFISSFFLIFVVVVVVSSSSSSWTVLALHLRRQTAFTGGEIQYWIGSIASHTNCIRARIKHQTLSVFNYTWTFSFFDEFLWRLPFTTATAAAAAAVIAADRKLITFVHFVSKRYDLARRRSVAAIVNRAPIDWAFRTTLHKTHTHANTYAYTARSRVPLN